MSDSAHRSTAALLNIDSSLIQPRSTARRPNGDQPNEGPDTGQYQMMTDRNALLAALFELDAALALHGVPALSPKWRADLTRWAERGSRRLVVRAGRRSGKSLTLCKLAIAMALFGGVQVPTGDTAWAVFVSTTITEALARLATIATFLDKLGVPYDRNGNQLRLTGVPLGFAVMACSHRSAVGMTAFMLAGDEVSRWETDGTNPAEEVAASLGPMTLTIPNALDVWSSSPLGTQDLHAQMVDAGDDDFQTVISGASWEFNPTVSEQQCRSLARTEREFMREYGNTPQGATLNAFDQGDVLKSFGDVPAGYRCAGWTCLVDPSGGGDDAWGYGLASWHLAPPVPEFLTERVYRGFGVEYEEYLRDEKGELIPNPRFADSRKPPLLRIWEYGQVTDARERGITLERIVAELARTRCHPNGARLVVGDQYEAFGLASEFPKHGLRYESRHWTNATKLECVARVASWMRDGTLSIQDGKRDGAGNVTGNQFAPELKKQLLSFDERISKSGAIKYSGRGAVHDDLVSVLLLAARADSEGLLPLSPYTPPQPHRTSIAELNRRFGYEDVDFSH